jgi:hypothetical protein
MELENEFFSFFFKASKRGKSEDKTTPKTDLWPTADRRESLTIPKRMISKDS